MAFCSEAGACLPSKCVWQLLVLPCCSSAGTWLSLLPWTPAGLQGSRAHRMPALLQNQQLLVARQTLVLKIRLAAYSP